MEARAQVYPRVGEVELSSRELALQMRGSQRPRETLQALQDRVRGFEARARELNEKGVQAVGGGLDGSVRSRSSAATLAGFRR